MGRRARRVLGVVAAIAVPFAAPVVAKAVGLSAAIGATAGSAVAGAALGAGAAAIGGTDIGRGAILGGIGGGISGYVQGAAGADAAAAAGGAGGAGGAAAAQPGFSLSDVMATSGGPVNYSLAPGATSGAGLNVSSIMAGGPAYAPAAAPLFSTAGSAGTNLANVMATSGDALAATSGGSFMEAIRGVPAAVAERFKDPDALADMTLRAGAALLGDAMAGDGLSPEEQRLLDAQVADLQALRERDEEMFKLRLQGAMDLLGEARYFDPQRFGLQAQAAVQVASAQQQREAQRAAELGPRGYSEADRRRAQLDTAAASQTAFLQGAESAQRQRMGLLAEGYSRLPDSPITALNLSAGLMTQHQQAMERAAKARRDAGGFFGDIVGTAIASRRTDGRNTIG